MAEKKKTVSEPEIDPMQQLVEVYLPKATGREENFVFVGLNGKGYQIRRGQSVMVPRPVYDILEASERAKQKQEDFIRLQHERAAATRL